MQTISIGLNPQEQGNAGGDHHRFRPFQHLLNYMVGIGVAIVVASTFSACSLIVDGMSPQELFSTLVQEASLTDLTEGNRRDIYERNGIKVQHGYGCAIAPQATAGLRIQDDVGIPIPYDTATVFLNGWYLEYLGEKDHEIAGLGTAIFNLEQNADILRWEAAGILSDGNADDAYRWCYFYTLVFWHNNFGGIQRDFAAVPRHDDGAGAELLFAHEDGFDGETTALRQLGGLVELEGGTPKAVLLRGFGIKWDASDYHLLQFAFDLGDTVTDPVEREISWVSQTIFKDNSQRRDYRALELVSVLSGASVEVEQPPFHIEPRSKSSCPNIGSPSFEEETVVVENVPFDYAIPMLTGWDIGDVCDDNHIKRIGAWISNFAYNPISRTLSYTIASTFTDDRNHASAHPRYKVNILGFNSLNQGIAPVAPLAPGTMRQPTDRRQAGASLLTVPIGAGGPSRLIAR